MLNQSEVNVGVGACHGLVLLYCLFPEEWDGVEWNAMELNEGRGSRKSVVKFEIFANTNGDVPCLKVVARTT